MKRGINSFSREKVYHRTLYSYYSRFHSLSVILSLPPSLCVCKYTHTCIFTYACIFVSLYTHIYVCSCMCIYFSHSSFNYSYFFLDDRLFHHVTPMKINLSVPAGQGRCLRPDHVEHKNLLLQWDFFFSLPISKTVNKLEETHPCIQRIP